MRSRKVKFFLIVRRLLKFSIFPTELIIFLLDFAVFAAVRLRVKASIMQRSFQKALFAFM